MRDPPPARDQGARNTAFPPASASASASESAAPSSRSSSSRRRPDPVSRRPADTQRTISPSRSPRLPPLTMLGRRGLSFGQIDEPATRPLPGVLPAGAPLDNVGTRRTAPKTLRRSNIVKNGTPQKARGRHTRGRRCLRLAARVDHLTPRAVSAPWSARERSPEIPSHLLFGVPAIPQQFAE